MEDFTPLHTRQPSGTRKVQALSLQKVMPLRCGLWASKRVVYYYLRCCSWGQDSWTDERRVPAWRLLEALPWRLDIGMRSFDFEGGIRCHLRRCSSKYSPCTDERHPYAWGCPDFPWQRPAIEPRSPVSGWGLYRYLNRGSRKKDSCPNERGIWSVDLLSPAHQRLAIERLSTVEAVACAAVVVVAPEKGIHSPSRGMVLPEIC